MFKAATRIELFCGPSFVRDPIPVPEKARKPLTQVQEFNLLVEHRAVDRAEFDKKVYILHLNLFSGACVNKQHS